MTYAAQVRNVSKSVSPQQFDDDFYDINTLRIICKYFVGSIVTLKTTDELIEGVLHTISHNKICLTLVTVAKLTEPEHIVETFSNKLINLSDVMLIVTNNNSNNNNCNSFDVTVKGKYIKKSSQDRKKSESKVSNRKIEAENQENEVKFDKKPLENVDDNNSLDLIDKKLEQQQEQQPKKLFAFNPNAPEFKPRINSVFAENIINNVLFSPHPHQQSPFPTVFTPTSAPAIFVPNIFFYAPNNNHMETNNNINSSADNNIDPSCERSSIPPDEQFILRKSMPELHHIPPSPFPMMPMFPPPLPIFVPNHSFKFANNNHTNNLPTFSNNFETESVNDLPDNNDNTNNNNNIDNELSNPSNWPPLPVPVNQGSISNCSNGESQKSV